MTAPTSTFEQLYRMRDERNQLRNRIDSFARLVDAAERGGATVMRIEDIRRGLGLGARR